MVFERVVSLVSRTLEVINYARDAYQATVTVKKTVPRVVKSSPKSNNKPVKRKLSVRPARQIHSERSEQILRILRDQNGTIVDKNAEVSGKSSLACILWALHAADQAEMKDGVSIHDVSALLFKAAKVELYPINVSRMVHDHTNLIHQVSQEMRTKRYALTDAGRAIATALPTRKIV